MSTFPDKEIVYGSDSLNDIHYRLFQERATMANYAALKETLHRPSREKTVKKDRFTHRSLFLPIGLAILLAIYGSRCQPEFASKEEVKPIAPITEIIKPSVTPSVETPPASLSFRPIETKEDPDLTTYYPNLGESLIGLAQTEAAKEIAKRNGSEFGKRVVMLEQKAQTEGKKKIDLSPDDPELRQYVAKFEADKDRSNRVYHYFVTQAHYMNKGLTQPGEDTFQVSEFKGFKIGPVIDMVFTDRATFQR